MPDLVRRSAICLSVFFFSCSLLFAQTNYADVAASLGVNVGYGLNGEFSGGLSFADFNQDGWDDITLTSTSGQEMYFFQNTGGTFTQIIPPPISNTSETKMPIWVDYDNDGDQDLFVTSWDDTCRLYRNNGAFQFDDVTHEANFTKALFPSHGACFGDYDNDGWLDLYITNYTEPNGENYLYQNEGDGTFKDVSVAAGVQDFGKLPFGASFLDYDNDGDVDLYVYQDKYTISNTLFQNNGNGTFTDVSVGSGADIAIDAMCIGIADYDGNGYMDMYVTNSPPGHALLQNNGNGTFSEVAAAAGVQAPGYVGWGSTFFDFDYDMDMDLYVCHMLGGGSHMYENNGNATFSLASGVGFLNDNIGSFTSAVGDYDNNGMPDLVVSKIDLQPTALWHATGISNNWLKVQLQGVQSNRDGIGARVLVYTNGIRQMQDLNGGIGFRAQDSKRLMFGLGNNTTVDSVIVQWPSGIVDKLYAQSINQTLNIVESASIFEIRLAAFTAQKVGSQVRIDWTSEREESGDMMVLERLNDHRELVRVDAKGYASDYRFWDQYPLVGTNAYQLRMIDQDGSETFSSVETVNFEGQSEIQIWPQPVNQELYILANGIMGPAEIRIYQINGNQAFSENWENDGLTKKRIDLPNLPNGLYFYKLKIGSEQLQGKLLRMD